MPNAVAVVDCVLARKRKLCSPKERVKLLRFSCKNTGVKLYTGPKNGFSRTPESFVDAGTWGLGSTVGSGKGEVLGGEVEILLGFGGKLGMVVLMSFCMGGKSGGRLAEPVGLL